MRKSLILLSLFTAFAACSGDKGRTLARVDGKNFTDEDLKLRLGTLPEDQLDAILKDPEQKRANFQTVFRNYLYAVAGEKADIQNRDSIARRLALIDQRVITQYYFDAYLNEYGGHTRKELEDYYHAHASKFKGDSGKTEPFYRVVSRVADSMVLAPVNIDSFYHAHPANYAVNNGAFPPLDSLRSRVMADYVRDYKAERSEHAVAELRKKYGVRTVTPVKDPTEADLQAYYDQNKDAYESPETYELYDIEVSDKGKWESKFKAVKDLAGFKALAAKASENAWTKDQGGYLGVVKRDFCLPYGVGMFPELFPVLDGMSPGKVAEPLQSADTQKWHFFWLVAKQPRRPKPLERMHALVRADLMTNRITHILPADTLAIYGDGRTIRESDVIFLQDEIPPQMRERYTREALVDYLITWQVVSDEAKALKLTDERRLISQRRQNDDSYWGRVYQDSVMGRTYEQDTAALAKTFAEKKGLFTKDSTERDWHNYAHDVAAYLTLVPRDFDVEYYTNPERYQRDSTLPALSAVMYEVFQNLKSAAYQRLDVLVFDRLKARLRASVVDPSLEEPSLEPTEAAYKKAQDLHYNRKLDQALALYGRLRDAFPDRAGLQDSICFGVAQIYIEQERYQQAMAEYRRVSYLYPNSPNNYKAMFMVGFIYSEHLKNDSAAVHAFEKMLAKYPNTDLSDDADWMLRNIRSGGKLMPKLEDDSTTVPSESAASKKEGKPKK